MASIVGALDYASSGGICRLQPLLEADCGRVYLIPQASILGIHLSVIAPGYFALASSLVVAYTLLGVRAAAAPALALYLAGALAVPYLVYLEVFVAEAICIWCTIMHASIVSTLALLALATGLHGRLLKRPV